MYQTIGEYLEYLELEKGLSQNTLDAYRRDLENFADTSDVDDVKNIDRLMINTYVRNLKEKKICSNKYYKENCITKGFFQMDNIGWDYRKKSCIYS